MYKLCVNCKSEKSLEILLVCDYKHAYTSRLGDSVEAGDPLQGRRGVSHSCVLQGRGVGHGGVEVILTLS